jgi:predicted phosphohydrolase
MRLQLLSDLHLENWRQRHYPLGFQKAFQKLCGMTTPQNETSKWVGRPPSKYLFLAGDIGYPYGLLYKDLLTFASMNYERVFLTTGNHEYYAPDRTMSQTNEYIEKMVGQMSNVHFLNNSYVDLDVGVKTYRVIGSTLWTHIPVDKYRECQDHANDYRYITSETGKLVTPHEISTLHQTAMNFIKKTVDASKNKDVIVLTHHLPTYQLIATKYLHYTFLHLYATELEDFIKEHPQLKLWMCGHTHTAMKTKIGNALCLCNPYGYIREDKANFDYSRVIDVPH